MPRGAKHGARRYQMPRQEPTPKQGYTGLYVAKIAGKSSSRISQLVRSGDLQKHDDGSITKESAHLYFWDEFVLAGILSPKLNPQGFYRDTEPELIQAKPESEGHTPIVDFQAARARQAYWTAEKTRIEVERMLGNLVPWEEIEYAMTATYTEFNQALLTLADQLTPSLVGIDDPRTIHGIIKSKTDDIINLLGRQLADMINRHYGDFSAFSNRGPTPTQPPVSLHAPEHHSGS